MSTNTINISSSAVLVDLSISVWTGRKMDKQVSAEIDADKNATVRAGNYHKALMAGARELEDINKEASAIRVWHTLNTLPWSDSGTRLLPTARLFDYKTELAQREQRFNLLIGDFLDAYDTLVQAAQFRLGALFNADEYPSRDIIARKFDLRYVFAPVPEAGDFRVDIGNEGLAELRSQYENFHHTKLQEAMREMWERVRDTTERLSKQLRVEGEEKGRLYQSTLDAGLELCEMLKSMNLTNDPELERTRKELFSTLNGVDLKELKKDNVARASVKAELDALMDKFSF